MADAVQAAAVERVLLAFDACAHPQPVLDAARLLALGTRRALEALLVEDADLFSVAALPFSREVDRRGGASRALDVQTLGRAMSARRRRLERALAAMAPRSDATPGLRVVRGRYLQEVLAAAAGFDAVLLGMGGPLVTPVRRGRGAVWVLCDDSTATGRAVALAHAVASASGAGLVLADREGDAGDGSPGRTAVPGAARTTVRRVALGETEAQRPGARLLREGAGLLVVCRDRAAKPESGSLLAGVPCPVLLVT